MFTLMPDYRFLSKIPLQGHLFNKKSALCTLPCRPDPSHLPSSLPLKPCVKAHADVEAMNWLYLKEEHMPLRHTPASPGGHSEGGGKQREGHLCEALPP